MFKKFNFNSFWLGLIITIALSLFAGRYLLFPGYFDMHDDLQITRQHQMDRCFQDGQIPCRWSPDLGAGRGFPMFNYYAPLPNYIGMTFRWIGFSYMNTVKALFLIGLIGSGIGMYLLAHRLTASWVAGITAATLYIFAPYHSLDIFVRGALAESWALMWFPLILLAIYHWAKNSNSTLTPSPFISLTIAGLYLSHNIMSMWFTPVIFSWTLIVILVIRPLAEHPGSGFWTSLPAQAGQNDILKKLLSFLISYLWALGLSAFFLLPALFEKNLVHTQNLIRDYFDYHIHFASWRQLFFDHSWGFGASREGPIDGISFQIGWPHWWLILAGAIVLILGLTLLRHSGKRETSASRIFSAFRSWTSLPAQAGQDDTKKYLFLCFFLFLFFCSVLMSHSKSVLVWETFPFLAWTQFPWRVLALIIFSSSVVGGLILNFFQPRIQYALATVIILATTIFNWSYTIPTGYNSRTTDTDKLTGQTWDQQRRGALLDYLPIDVKTFEVYLPPEPVLLLPTDSTKSAVQASYREWHQRSDFFSFDVEVFGEDSVNVKVAVFDFPNWQIYMDDHLIEHHHNNDLGSIAFTVPPGGKRHITAWFRNTPTRQIANTITVASYLLLVYYFFKPKNN